MDLDLREAQRDNLINIAVQVGVLKRCDLHEEIVINNFVDPAPVYRIANAQFNNGELLFPSRTELNDAVKDEIEDAQVGGCPLCDRLFRAD